MAQFNPCFTATWLLLVLTWALIVFAISSPNWSHTDNLTAGLWVFCSRVTTNWWSCSSYTDPIKSNGFVVAACTLCVIGAVLSFVASCFACTTIMLGNVCFGLILVVICLLCYIIISLGWGMWLGAHNDNFKAAGFDLSYSFALAVGSSVMALLAVCSSLAAIVGHKRYAKQKELEMVNAVAGSPGASTPGVENTPPLPREDVPPYDYPEFPASRDRRDPTPSSTPSYHIYGSVRRNNSPATSHGP
eukprot:GGOE01020156.1.p1 GENE.GGOE01020156.1~~GGOE01020156.1.p1  ORF type:complete len:253 (-),score=65.65 GGOE01020156.1:645-1382(-)